ncbi:MAG TPA: prepilin peptidase, partial [Flavobacterium sp.]|nr:prepilin peptidase [Flavobacterium sp.]
LYLAIIAVVVFIVLYDFKYYLILDASVFLGIALALPISIIRGSIAVDVISALGLFALFLGMYMFSKGRWLGFGDVKLAIFLGLISGPLVFLTLILSSWMGVLVGLVLFLSRHGKGLKTELPFGTLLGLAAIIVLIGSTYLSDIISQYMF